MRIYQRVPKMRILFCFVCAFFFFQVQQVHAGVQTPTGQGYVSGTVTTNSAEVYVTFSGNPGSGTKYVLWTTTSGSYVTGHYCVASSAGPVAYSYKCTLTGLSSGTTYYIKGKFIDSNLVNYSSSTQASFTTLSPTTPPSVAVSAVSNIGTTTATGNGNVTAVNGANPSSRIIQWGTSSGAYIGSCEAGAGGAGAFACTMSGLSPHTYYYVRACAYNTAGWGCSGETAFTTTTAVPTVTAQSVSNIGTATATGNGTVTATGGVNPSSRIVQWGITSGSYTNSCNAGAGGTGAFSCAITGLSPNTTYYATACAYNTAGWGCSGQISFTTAVAIPTVSTSAITDITTASATGNGSVTATGGANLTARVIQWGTTSGVYTNSCNAGAGGSGAFSCAITGLLPNVTYYVQAYATNSAGTGYGAQTSFTTTVGAPSVTTQAATDITINSGTIRASVTDIGGQNPTRYIEWGTTTGTYTTTCDAGIGGTGTYLCNLTNLSPNTTYFYRAKVTNNAGTAYGSEMSFTTLTDTPETTTVIPSSVTTDSAVGNGTIIDTGGEDPERFIQWGTQTNTYNDECSAGIGGMGAFSCAMMNLQPNTTYYTRAKATNSAGTTYGDEMSFITQVALPTVTTGATSNITTTSAQISANVSSTGGENDIRYIEWGTQSNSYTHTCDLGAGSAGVYTCDLTGLNYNTTYYYKAKASNSAGTSYGNEMSFTTLVALSTLTTQSTTQITPTSARLRGEITNAGGENVYIVMQYTTESNNYESAQECIVGNNAEGQYVCDVSDFTPNTTYYIRMIATNSAGTTYGQELSFTTLNSELTIPDPDTDKITSAVNNGYIATDNDSDLTQVSQATTRSTVTTQTQNANVTFPQDTTITGDGDFNFQQFTTENITNTIRNDQPTSRAAIDLGIQGEQLNFSQDITMEIYVGTIFNDLQMEVLYQNDGESDWHHHTYCTIANGYCTFTTDHATIYTINGEHTVTGDLPLNINVEVQETLSMDCFDPSDSNTTVQIGTTADPGKVTAGTPAVGQSRCTVTTNADQGYYLTLQNDNTVIHPTLTHTDPNTGTIYEIPELTQYTTNIPNTQNWTAPTTKGLGFSVISFPQADTTHNTFDGIWTETHQCPEGTNPDTNDYAGIPQTAQTISAVTAYQATATTTDVCYKVDVLPSQPSGQYTGSVTFTATSDASGYYQ